MPRSFPLTPPFDPANPPPGVVVIPDPDPTVTWTPPLVNGTDYLLLTPSTRTRPIHFDNGRHVVVKGLHIKIGADGLGEMMRYSGGSAGRIIHIEDAWLDPNGHMLDCAKTENGFSNGIVQWKTLRIETLFGNLQNTHSDALQTSGGIQEFWGEDIHVETAYFAFQTQMEASKTGAAYTVTGAVRNGMTATIKIPNHPFTAGQYIQLEGINPNGYNGGFKVNSVAGTGTQKTITVTLGTQSPGTYTGGGAATQIIFKYTIGKLNWNRVSVNGVVNPVAGIQPTEAIGCVRLGCRPAQTGGQGSGHPNEDETPLLYQAWPGSAISTDFWATLPPGTANVGKFVAPDTSSTVVAVARAVLDTGTTPDQVAWPNWPAAAGMVVKTGPHPSGHDAVEIIGGTPPGVADRYVKATGSDTTGDGSLGAPYATLHKAWTALSGAERVIGVVGDIGSAATDCVLDGKTGTSTNPYVVCGAHADGSLITTAIDSTRPSWMPVVLGKIRIGASANTTYLTLRQLEMNLAISPVGPGLLPLDCDHLEINACVVTNHNQPVGGGSNSIALNAGFSGTPSDLWIHHSWLVDIGDMGNDTVQVEPSGWFSHAIYLESVTRPLVEHCVIKHISGRGVQLFGGTGVANGIYRYCLFDDCGMAVIVDSHAVNNSWTRNLFAHTRNYAVITQGSSYTGSGNSRDANAYYANPHGNGTFLPDAHAVSVGTDPFTDYAGGDIGIVGGSPAAGYGPDFLQPGYVAGVPTPMWVVSTVAPTISAVTITGTPQAGQTLSASEAVTGSPTPGVTRRWKKGPSPTGPWTVFGGTAQTQPLSAAEVGSYILVTETATNSVGSASADSTAVGPVTAAAQPPHFTIRPIVSGSGVTGSTVSVDDGTVTGDPPITYTYLWARRTPGTTSWVTIVGATANTLLLDPSLVGLEVTAFVSASNATASEFVEAQDTILVHDPPATLPMNTRLPAITLPSGPPPRVGQIVKGDDGAWSGTTPMTAARQWYRSVNADGSAPVAIGGATQKTYTVASADRAHTLVYGVTMTNSAGPDAAGEVRSPPTPFVGDATPAPSPPPGVSLGCGVYDVYILERGGGVIRHSLDTWTSVKYQLPLGAAGQASVSLAGLSKTVLDQCCATLHDVLPWADELAIYRRVAGELQGTLVWVGPVGDPELDQGVAQIPALDLAAWFDVRFIHHDLAWAGHDAASVAAAIVHDALQPDPSPNIRILASAAGFDWSESVLADSYTLAGERLRALADGGLRWYMNRRVFVACGDPDTPLLLTDQSFVGEPQIKLVGSAQATRIVSTGQGVGADTAITASAQADTAHTDLYGLVERVRRTQATDQASVDQDAAASLDLLEDPIAVVESGVLSENAPVTFQDLAPGRRCHLRLSETCYPIDGVYRLSLVEVDTASGNEQITTHFTPVGATLA